MHNWVFAESVMDTLTTGGILSLVQPIQKNTRSEIRSSKVSSIRNNYQTKAHSADRTRVTCPYCVSVLVLSFNYVQFLSFASFPDQVKHHYIMSLDGMGPKFLFLMWFLERQTENLKLIFWRLKDFSKYSFQLKWLLQKNKTKYLGLQVARFSMLVAFFLLNLLNTAEISPILLFFGFGWVLVRKVRQQTWYKIKTKNEN